MKPTSNQSRKESPSGGAVSTQRLSIRYGRKTALQPVTTTFRENCVTGLVGPSGCGKTSFLNCLNRLTDLIPGCSVSGQVKIHERDIFQSDVDVRQLRLEVGMIFQQPTPFPMSIRANLELPLKDTGTRHPTDLEEKITASLRAVGLWKEVKDRLKNSAHLLSGGQQQRLCIARALVLAPKVLLMDEPCSSLDPMATAKIEDLILQLKERYTILIVTHNLPQARRVSDDIAVFWLEDGSGTLVEFGHRQQIFGSPQEAITKAYVRGTQG